ncbi:hypothetical protein ACNRBH_09195 [Ralstonia pseudosolanacearum]|uniref:hypothetical protein n=1 Tax=Ralstonia pseudosolanacearum TaxID=1310165 RepID=UPI0026757004|nr:hypothetical protein [Ralstonia pseudosolanacearum]MDO3527536.1 hypothetical protein [Ralstonia pseudosolanacearum]MDO3531615.1 hypothetical protein [Ralstonia pseudosolanacearum]
MTPFDCLVRELSALERQLAAQAQPREPRIPADSLERAIADAQRADRLRVGDIDRIEAACEIGAQIPHDVLARVLGEQKH